MRSLKDILADNLSRLLREKRKTQVELAEELGVSFKTVNQYLNGRGGISGEMITKFASALDVTEGDLVSDQLEITNTPGMKALITELKQAPLELRVSLPGVWTVELRELLQRDQARAGSLQKFLRKKHG